MNRFGFIGLGSQGGPMARRMIDAGLPTILWARRAQTLEPFADSTAEVATSIAELGASVLHVGICVVDDAGVQQVCDSLIPVMRPGSRIVIHSTVNPELCRRLAKAAGKREIALMDAPVSGGGESAQAGTLTVMVGGEARDVAAAKPVLETFAGLILHLGDVGAGQNAKLVNNAMMSANLAIAHHGLAAAETLGIAREAFVDLVKVSSGRSLSFEVRARMPNPGAFEHGAMLLAKDLGLLGEAMGDDPSFRTIRDVSRSFLDLALKG